MSSVVIPETLWPAISHLDPGGRESAGIALASRLEPTSNTLLVRSVFTATADDYIVRDGLRATLSPAFVVRSAAVARHEQLCVVFFHTHPQSQRPSFSAVDDSGERDLAEFLARRIPSLPHASLLIGSDNHIARIVGTGEPLEVKVVGRDVITWSRGSSTATQLERYDRQVRFFGAAAQVALSRLQVAIIGLGGTGSIVAQELAHLGVRRFRLVDPDVVDASNLSRVVGASHRDVGRRKVEIAEQLIQRVNTSTEIVARSESVNRSSEVSGLLSSDLIVCCTDSHGSRYVVNQVAYQYYIPVVDVGVAIAAAHGAVTHAFGRVQLLAAGLPCLTCLRLLDPHQVRRDLMSENERAADPYIIGDNEPQPAVISLNATMSSLAVSMVLGMFAKIPFAARYQLYDALRGTVRPLAAAPMPDCVTCSPRGALGRGASWPAPGTFA